MTEAEYPQWLASEKVAYVGDIVRAGALSPEEAVRKSDRDFAELILNGLATPDNTFLVLEAAGEQIGKIQSRYFDRLRAVAESERKRAVSSGTVAPHEPMRGREVRRDRLADGRPNSLSSTRLQRGVRGAHRT